ncbi:MAG: thioredoxin family protein [Deltaproteobacteria bacterium]|nr:thioredoxin family protein [Deltaproteobacteria bacterium]
MIGKTEKGLVTQLGSDNIGVLMGEEDQPVLIACLCRDKDFQGNIRQLEGIAASFSHQLSVCFALEDLLPYFTKRYGIIGTPTFLIIRQGDLIETMLGKNPTQSVIDFCNEHISANTKKRLNKDPRRR